MSKLEIHYLSQEKCQTEVISKAYGILSRNEIKPESIKTKFDAPSQKGKIIYKFSKETPLPSQEKMEKISQGFNNLGVRILKIEVNDYHTGEDYILKNIEE